MQQKFERIEKHLYRRGSDSFFDGRNGDVTDLIGESVKQGHILHFSKNFHDAFIAAVLGTADDETAFKNLVLVGSRVTQGQESVVGIEREFMIIPGSTAGVISDLEGKRQIEVADLFDGAANVGF